MQGDHQMLPPMGEQQMGPPGFGPPGTQGWANDVYIGKTLPKLYFYLFYCGYYRRTQCARQYECTATTFATTDG